MFISHDKKDDPFPTHPIKKINPAKMDNIMRDFNNPIQVFLKYLEFKGNFWQTILLKVIE